MPRGTYCKKRAKDRIALLQKIMGMDLLRGSLSFGSDCTGVFNDGMRELVLSAILTYDSPYMFLSTISMMMKFESKSLGIGEWFRVVNDNHIPNGGNPTQESKEAVEAFVSWYSNARQFLEIQLSNEYMVEGESNEGKAKIKVLERRFGARWSEKIMAAQPPKPDNVNLNFDGKFKGFLSD